MGAVMGRFNKNHIDTDAVRKIVLPHYADAESVDTPLEGVNVGIINATFRWGNCILQRINPIFDERGSIDAANIQSHLSRNGICIPEILRNDLGLYTLRVEGTNADGLWRVMRSIPGKCVTRVTNEKQAESAAEFLARLHDALKDFDYRFNFGRLKVHDIGHHIAMFRQAIASHSEHRLFREVVALSERLFQLYDIAGAMITADLPERIVHGDPKISNFIFDDEDNVTAMVDPDTFARYALCYEVGDAVRSWCNRSDENHVASYDGVLADKVLERYASIFRLTKAEAKSIEGAAFVVATELSARFARDALEENYFGFDPEIAPHGEHSLMRARFQCDLAEQILSVLPRA